MKRAVILHGICDEEEYYSENEPSPSNNNWIAWLQKQLVLIGYDCQTPEVLNSYKGIYEDWKRTFELMNIDRDTILIGHSAGCGFFLKWLSQNTVSIDKVYMIAPWIDPFGEFETTGFLECKLHPDLNNRINEIHILYSNDDPVKGVKETVDLIMDNFPSISTLNTYDGLGHFSSTARGTAIFPEIMDVIDKNEN